MKNTEYASFQKRLIASLIDIITLIALVTVIFIIEFKIYEVAYGELNFSNTKHFKYIYLMMAISSFLFMVMYFSILECSKWQGGIGKVTLKICVVDNCGHRLTFAKSLARALFKCIFLGLYFTYISIIFTKERKTLYDYLLGTIVINRCDAA